MNTNEPQNTIDPDENSQPSESNPPPAKSGPNDEPVAPTIPPESAAPPESALQKMDASFGGTLGQVELLTDAERANLFACETVIETGWQTFVQVGLALAQIRDQRLYKEEYHTFEAYCRLKWEYGRNYVNRLISAAQVFTHLVTISHQKPERETQVRPLVGLSPAEAQQAWERAVAVAGGRNVTERLVKQIVRQIKPPQTETAAVRTARPSKTEQRKQIDAALGELLMLSGQTPIADVLTPKIEALHGLIQRLFAS